MKNYLDELLVITMEECGEVIQECSKIIRFGANEENIERLEKEIGDLTQMIDLMHKFDLVSYTNIDEHSEKKYEKLKKFSNLIPDYE